MRGVWRLTVVLACLSGTAWAESPPQVALLDVSRLWAKGGIERWAAARAKLDSEKDDFVVVESPPDHRPLTMPDLRNAPASVGENLRRHVEELERARVKTEAWELHERQVLGPIEADVLRELVRFARARKAGLVLNASTLGKDTVLVVAPGVDITDAFITYYNARFPASRPPTAKQ